jgi:hypothetical protein
MSILWKLFLGAIAGVALFFSAEALTKVSYYVSLDKKAKAHVTHWEVREKGDEAFAIVGEYTFSLRGKELTGETEFAEPYFLNEISAKKAVEKLKTESWTVFFSGKNPEKSSLQRFFPFLTCIRAFLVLGVFVYFLFLGRWFKKRRV